MADRAALNGKVIVDRVNTHCELVWCKNPEHDCRKGNDNMSACARCLEEAIDAALLELQQENARLRGQLERIALSGCSAGTAQHIAETALVGREW